MLLLLFPAAHFSAAAMLALDEALRKSEGTANHDVGDVEEEVVATPLRPIRERLRDFAKTELSGQVARLMPRDYSSLGATQNSMTRVESRTLVQIDGEGDGADDQLLGDGAFSGDGDAGGDGSNVVLSLERPYGAVAPQPGDLLEVSTDSWRVQLLAVCLGNFRGVDHFYTNTGKWFVSSGVRSLFGVTGFASPAELAPVIAALPAAAVSDVPGDMAADGAALEKLLNEMQEKKMGPTREAGAGLILKMNAFAQKSASIHTAHASVLDNAFMVLRQSSALSSTDERRTYMTLDDIAAVLLRKGGHTLHGQRLHNNQAGHSHGHSLPVRNLKSGGAASAQKDDFTPEAMYAVHKAIMTDELAFHPLTANTGGHSKHDNEIHSRSCMYTIASKEDMEIVRDVEQIVRSFYEDPDRIHFGEHPSDAALKKTRLGQFALRARTAIDRSRLTRSWSPYGMLGPEKRQKKQPPPRDLPIMWTDLDLRILHFMHLWASFQRFSTSSRLHWVGASVLRALERYGEAEYLTMATGWTLLQEVGWVAPWDLPARYSMALPDVPPLRTGGLLRELSVRQPSSPSVPLLADDIFAQHRRDWADLPVYCIDAIGASDIDDGISLERTANPDEFWIRVHVADPASSILPGSPLAELAARLPQTAYLPGHHVRMLPNDVVRERFSLAPNRPCLTFSAKVDRRNGTVLASEITPGWMRRAVFITPDDVTAVVADAEAAAIRENRTVASNFLQPPAHLNLPGITTTFSVGKPPASVTEPTAAHGHRMTTAADLGPDERADLEILATLATSLRAVRLANGAMPLYWPRPSVEVSLSNTDVVVLDKGVEGGTSDASSSFLQCTGDPYIRIWYDGVDDQANALASNAGSRLVESIMRLAGEVAADWCHTRGIAVPFRGQPDAARHLPQLRALTRDHVYPKLVAGSRPSEAALRPLRRLLGADEVTAEAVPHVTMGVARYVKATSPLRRYADLVTHWQIEGELLREIEANETSKPRGANGPPFTRDQLEHDVLPLLRVRERTMRALDNRTGRDQWMLQALVRAWLGEGDKKGGESVGKAGKKGANRTKDNADASALLSNLRFTVSSVNAQRGLVMGQLNWFERPAVIDAIGLNSDVNSNEGSKLDLVHIDSILPGQVFPVELAHVDVHGNLVLVRRTGEAL
ncbi:mitochondrial exoribonuclease [Grosmannia clavigera kw1407]|uniref:Mitochondrial exoribonuclease n=1 Tax=Grosmannia clavigera (strain kw1407 / UAMH 11150) TaxID=655863 RepID=F0XHB6_GROCL|nr:mitochondrial exoribonuclease [Grosmannia clavigera kw1407]EFX02806.1 mitochondrial exoribonuclease [Grosmannia clavigera kw1407]